MSKIRTVYEIGCIKLFTSTNEQGRICVNARLASEEDIEIAGMDALVAAAKAGVAAAQASIDDAFKQEASNAA